MKNTNLYNLKFLNRLLEAEKYFTKKKYMDIVELARELFERGQFDLCEEQLDKLPTIAELLESLIERLKDKHLYKTLRKIQESKVGNDLLTAKGLSSLLTHTIIEVEQGNTEYKILLPNLLEKISEIIYKL